MEECSPPPKRAAETEDAGAAANTAVAAVSAGTKAKERRRVEGKAHGRRK
jgi:hypothetical protein